jgi:hypothetical protein
MQNETKESSREPRMQNETKESIRECSERMRNETEGENVR